MRLASSFCVVGIVVSMSSITSGTEYYDQYYPDPNVITVERDGKIVDRLPCERVALDFPELDGRAEGHLAFDTKGNLWAAVACTVCKSGSARLFHSQDGGKTWTSRLLQPAERGKVAAFAVLKDNTMLAVLSYRCEDVEIYSSPDMGKTWTLSTTLVAAPFRCIGEGTESLTTLRDGRVLFPVARFTHPSKDLVLDKRLLLHSVYVSQDGGKTFPVAHSTFPDSMETHLLELQSGQLLGAFRHQRWPYTDESLDKITQMGGIKPGATVHGVKIGGGFVLKHVFLGDSEDGGVTWKNFRPVRDKQGHSLLEFGEAHGQLVQVPDGRVVLASDRRYPYENGEVRARVSADGGQTWSPEIYHMGIGPAYPSSVSLADGTIVTITGNTPLEPGSKHKTGWRAQVVRWKLP